MSKWYQRVKDMRLKAHITREELAVKTGLTPSLISRIENGNADPRYSTLVDISKALGVDISTLLFSDEDKLFGQIMAIEDDVVRTSALNLANTLYPKKKYEKDEV